MTPARRVDCFNLPHDDRKIERMVQCRRVHGAPHAVVAREDRVHHEYVAYEVEVGVVVSGVIEDDEGTGKARPRAFRYAAESWLCFPSRFLFLLPLPLPFDPRR